MKLAGDVCQLLSGMALKYGAATVQWTRFLMQYGCKDQAGTIGCTPCSRLVLSFLNPSLEYHVTSLDLTDRYGSAVPSTPAAIVFTRLRGNPRLRMAHRSITIRFELNCNCECATLRQRF